MTHKLNDVPIERLMVEHYLFDLGYPVETVCEISGMDLEFVKKIYDDYKMYTSSKASTK